MRGRERAATDTISTGLAQRRGNEQTRGGFGHCPALRACRRARTIHTIRADAQEFARVVQDAREAKWKDLRTLP
jgi:hypothetical protein